MRKLWLTIVVLLATLTAMAQPRAIGGRIGYGVEASYEHAFGESNMISIDAGFPGFNGTHVVATYDWIFPFKSWSGEGEWNWYAGPGLGTGLWNFNEPHFMIGAAGRIGVEYTFWFPLQLSIDYRPILGVKGNEFFSEGLFFGSIAARYRF